MKEEGQRKTSSSSLSLRPSVHLSGSLREPQCGAVLVPARLCPVAELHNYSHSPLLLFLLHLLRSGSGWGCGRGEGCWNHTRNLLASCSVSPETALVLGFCGREKFHPSIWCYAVCGRCAHVHFLALFCFKVQNNLSSQLFARNKTDCECSHLQATQ